MGCLDILEVDFPSLALAEQGHTLINMICAGEA